jgi:uncharacterized membrane protein YedE/YeeE
MDWNAARSALEGGALIGLAVSGLLLLTGKTAGVSSVVEGALRREKGEWEWKAAFVLGLIAGGVILRFALPGTLPTSAPRAMPLIAVGGVLVGLGARVGGGCTSGHGVCGIGRLSLRGLVGTLTFMVAGMATVYVFRRLG